MTVRLGGVLEQAMADSGLDWAALLDGRTVRQWLVALGEPEAATATQEMLAYAVRYSVAFSLRDLPAGWYVWRGVGPHRPFYARRPRTSPAWVVWAGTLDQVAKAASDLERSKTR